MSETADFSLSKLSLHSEDWDMSSTDIRLEQGQRPCTPSSSRAPQDRDAEATPGGEPTGIGKSRRSLSDLLRLHAEKGRDLKLSAEEEEVLSEELGHWINSDSSPYEPDDDFFTRSQDDSALLSKATSSGASPTTPDGRPRGQSESCVRPGSRPSSAGVVTS